LFGQNGNQYWDHGYLDITHSAGDGDPKYEAYSNQKKEFPMV